MKLYAPDPSIENGGCIKTIHTVSISEAKQFDCVNRKLLADTLSVLTTGFGQPLVYERVWIVRGTKRIVRGTKLIIISPINIIIN